MASEQMVSTDIQVGSSITPLSIVRYWGPVGLYAGLIFFGSSISTPPEAISSLIKEISDKVLHLSEYALFGALIYRASRHGSGPWMAQHAVLAAVAGSALYGVSDETHQWFVPLREADVLDVVADTVGGIVGAWGWRWIERHAYRD
ncbi:MAG: VanZ domain-containing protein [Nitrospira sp.]|nr:MAG: VanZ domain-containing protein [Nitrospira sp.]